MTPARRLSAAIMVLVLALLPVALERCRTACVTNARQATTQAGPAGHACHAAASDDPGAPRLDPMARACGHNEEARTYESASLAAARSRTAWAAVSPSPQHLQTAAAVSESECSPDRSHLLSRPLPLNSPLRL